MKNPNTIFYFAHRYKRQSKNLRDKFRSKIFQIGKGQSLQIEILITFSICDFFVIVQIVSKRFL